VHEVLGNFDIRQPQVTRLAFDEGSECLFSFAAGHAQVICRRGCIWTGPRKVRMQMQICNGSGNGSKS
jgi:hypothetical protein